MKRLIAVILFLSLAGNADAESFKHWWKHHHFPCLCIGNPPASLGGN